MKLMQLLYERTITPNEIKNFVRIVDLISKKFPRFQFLRYEASGSNNISKEDLLAIKSGWGEYDTSSGLRAVFRTPKYLEMRLNCSLNEVSLYGLNVIQSTWITIEDLDTEQELFNCLKMTLKIENECIQRNQNLLPSTFIRAIHINKMPAESKFREKVRY
jgi:hypothetical protein